MKKKVRSVILLLFGLCMMCGISVTAHAADKMYMPDRAVRAGNYIYYAIGNDGEGYVYRYHIPSKKKKLLLQTRCKHLSAKGQYLYMTVDKYSGSDNSNHFIYRAKKNGSGLKKLANGHSPVVIGKHIYYIGTQKGKFYSSTVDSKVTGVWRMNLNGRGKKCIYKSSDIQLKYGRLYSLSNNRLVLQRGDNYHSMTLSGKKLQVYPFGLNTYANTMQTPYWVMKDPNTVCSNQKGYKFSAASNRLYRTKGNSRKTIHTFPGNESIQKIIDLNGYLFVITHKEYTHANVYILDQNGKGKKKTYSFILAGGGW